jgi:DNA-directed RNA polymerase II subunit RPB1
MLDPIISIEEVESTAPKVYDFTVADTRNFTIFGGLCVLDTFHYSGVASKQVTVGFPRLNEVINVTRNIATPCMTLVPREARSAHHVMRTAVRACTHTLAQYVLECHVGPTHRIATMSNTDRRACKQHMPRGVKHLLRFVLDVPRMIQEQVSTRMLRRYVQEQARAQCQQTCVVWHTEPYDARRILYVALVPGAEDTKAALQALGSAVCNVGGGAAPLCGIPGVTRATVRLQDGAWVIDTNQTNLGAMLGDEQWFKVEQCVTNHVVDVYETLGIEAARCVLLQELSNVLTFDGTYLNARHLTLLVDTMCHSGDLRAMTRHSMKRQSNSTLKKASFEQTFHMLEHAASYGASDDICGVAENIIFGQSPNMGTHHMQLCLNERLVQTCAMEAAHVYDPYAQDVPLFH